MIRSIVTFWVVLMLHVLSASMVLAQEEIKVWDPIEPVNRGIFWFNDQIDYLILEPVARGYDYVVPDEVQGSVSNFFTNLSYPGFLFNDIVGLDFEAGAVHTGRFAINSTLGVLGLFDVAEDFGLEHQPIDFGVTLGKYGVGAGPYLVLPIFGPSNFRDGIGRAVDSYVDPFTLATYADMDEDDKIALVAGANTLRIINQRSSLLNTIDSAKEGSVDYYLTVQSFYYQMRNARINPKTEAEKDAWGEDEEFLPE